MGYRNYRKSFPFTPATGPWTVARELAAQGFWPDTISTDVHTTSIKAPIAVDMPNAMSKLLHLGMPLEAVVQASTVEPARCMGWDDRIGSLRPGLAADVALLALEEGDFPLTDSYGQTEHASRRLVARHTVRAGAAAHLSGPGAGARNERGEGALTESAVHHDC